MKLVTLVYLDALKHFILPGVICFDGPFGVTGLRMTMNGVQHLKETGGRYAILFICLSAEQGLAMLIENSTD